MAKGRKKKPSNLKVLAGTNRADRDNPDEPIPELEYPGSPAHFDDIEKTYWKYYAEILYRVRVLTEADLSQLEIYVLSCSDAKKFKSIVDNEGIMLTVERWSKDGSVTFDRKPHPLLMRIKDARDAINKYGSVLGLNPADRSKIVVARKPEKKGMKSFLTQV